MLKSCPIYLYDIKMWDKEQEAGVKLPIETYLSETVSVVYNENWFQLVES